MKTPVPTACRKFPLALALCLGLAFPASAQEQTPAAAPGTTQSSPGNGDTGCCGAVTPAGKHLRQVLDGMDVEHLWLSHMHVNWETGASDRPADYRGSDTHTHCSAFAAAVGERIGIYMLRPPDHPQTLLASAQGRWFEGKDARKEGWQSVATARQAQHLANEGELVVIVFISPDEHKPGHIAIVRPAMKTDELLAKEGPQTTQAGGHNFSSGTAKYSFGSHEDAWPNGVKMYVHDTAFHTSKVPAS